MDIDAYWEYSDPMASEERFRAVLTAPNNKLTADERLEILTQLARTYSLRRRCEEAHALLDEVAPALEQCGPRPRIRYGLERGRTFNATGDKEQARTLFEQAWSLAIETAQLGLAVDAAHMVAITLAGTQEGVAWARKGLTLAEQSTDAKAQALIPAMLNNTAWDLHEMGEFTEALTFFERAQQAWEERGKARPIQIAKWSVARCLRSLARHREALEILYLLEAEQNAQAAKDGYVFEEIGENLYAMGQSDAAKPYFRQAATELEQDPWLVDHEPERLAQLRARA